MILIDSNILIEYYRDRKSILAKTIDSLPVALCGIVKSEVLHGAKSDSETDQIFDSFNAFDLLYTEEYDYEFAGLLLQTLRVQGIQVPFADAMIAYTAIKYAVPLWTNDRHFKYIQGVFPELNLYTPGINKEA